MAKNKKKKETKKMEGLGDVVHAVTSTLGIDKLVKMVFTDNGIDCGCDDRRKRWNKAYSFSRPPHECLTEKEFLILDEMMTTPPHVITNLHQQTLRKISDRIYRERSEMSSCDSCIRNLWKKMETVWKDYKENEADNSN